ncbi:UNKNOWN [Stylonychia lemnae]|uniref:Uncharacterized protein n=1 Tax=Stylonychia lemnae TaxID=5949 RepID=A0A078B7G4_STYLE|nr:UNKNOWN [Stylonychia lemnae]|eukprot:CDW90435.1 UNKNOWN [Stylonychia lemnae]
MSFPDSEQVKSSSYINQEVYDKTLYALCYLIQLRLTKQLKQGKYRQAFYEFLENYDQTKFYSYFQLLYQKLTQLDQTQVQHRHKKYSVAFKDIARYLGLGNHSEYDSVSTNSSMSFVNQLNDSMISTNQSLLFQIQSGQQKLLSNGNTNSHTSRNQSQLQRNHPAKTENDSSRSKIEVQSNKEQEKQAINSQKQQHQDIKFKTMSPMRINSIKNSRSNSRKDNVSIQSHQQKQRKQNMVNKSFNTDLKSTSQSNRTNATKQIDTITQSSFSKQNKNNQTINQNTSSRDKNNTTLEVIRINPWKRTLLDSFEHIKSTRQKNANRFVPLKEITDDLMQIKLFQSYDQEQEDDLSPFQMYQQQQIFQKESNLQKGKHSNDSIKKKLELNMQNFDVLPPFNQKYQTLTPAQLRYYESLNPSVIQNINNYNHKYLYKEEISQIIQEEDDEYDPLKNSYNVTKNRFKRTVDQKQYQTEDLPPQILVQSSEQLNNKDLKSQYIRQSRNETNSMSVGGSNGLRNMLINQSFERKNLSQQISNQAMKSNMMNKLSKLRVNKTKIQQKRLNNSERQPQVALSITDQKPSSNIDINIRYDDVKIV